MGSNQEAVAIQVLRIIRLILTANQFTTMLTNKNILDFELIGKHFLGLFMLILFLIRVIEIIFSMMTGIIWIKGIFPEGPPNYNLAGKELVMNLHLSP